ncbi:unnamed protein product [Arabidopsis arenosa]|uniref:non-specific serine/threonine protein kinase n=1 Tax=Arabidopsis arenosa TaxID=38785 RepID=A0A8S2A0E2_ARAAE|nr:unnamed protein product [Arabidopsis arenosa]
MEMKNLTSLKVLNISNNGSFPGEIVKAMVDLEVLDAYNNDFTGTLPLEIPELKKHKHLSLGGNFFNGEIPDSYGDIQSLEYLGLRAGLSGKSPAFPSRLKNVREMYIGYYNSYTGGITPEFGGLTKLEILDMASCTLTLTGEIPQSFIDLGNITLINLFRNKLYGQIPDIIGDLPKLEVFEVWENNFTLQLPANLGRNGKLIKLDVSHNHLTGLIPMDCSRVYGYMLGFFMFLPTLRIGLLYMISGFGGSLLSSLFNRAGISVGASGALFGLLGAMLSELLTNWTIYANKFAALLTLIFIIAINLAVGILPHVDNFAHLGGFSSGFLLGFVFMIRPQYGYFNQRNNPRGYAAPSAKSKHKPYQYVLWITSLVLLIAGGTRKSHTCDPMTLKVKQETNQPINPRSDSS